MVRTQDLPQEDRQGDQRRIDSADPESLDRCQCALVEVLREDIGEWQITVLMKPTPQKPDLLVKPALLE